MFGQNGLNVAAFTTAPDAADFAAAIDVDVLIDQQEQGYLDDLHTGSGRLHFQYYMQVACCPFLMGLTTGFAPPGQGKFQIRYL